MLILKLNPLQHLQVNLNTSNVNVNHFFNLTYFFPYIYLNTSNVNVNLEAMALLYQTVCYLNTSNVNVNLNLLLSNNNKYKI